MNRYAITTTLVRSNEDDAYFDFTIFDISNSRVSCSGQVKVFKECRRASIIKTNINLSPPKEVIDEMLKECKEKAL